MGKKPKTRIAVVVDRSGSMQGSTLSDHIGGLRTFIKEQQGQVGTTKFTLVQFDTVDAFEVLYDDVNINDVNVSEVDIIPRGGTPLLDALGRTIANLEAHEKKKKSDDVIVMIITDGHENASTEWTREKIKEAVSAKQKQWTFMFIGAGLEAFGEAHNYGFNANQVVNVGNDSANLGKLYGELTSGKISLSRNLRSSGASEIMVSGCREYSACDVQDVGFINSHIQ